MNRIVGVLNDFDLVSQVVAVGAEEPSSKHRTGTKPFMAIELLSDLPCLHKYRHDLESLFYVILWHTHRFQDGRCTSLEYDDWARDSVDIVRKTKSDVVSGFGPLSHPLPPYFKLHKLLMSYRQALQAGFYAWSMHIQQLDYAKTCDPEFAETLKFDEDTLEGHLSFDAVDKIFLNNRP